MLLNSTKNYPVARELDREKDFPKGTFNLKGTKLNVLIRDNILFVGVDHLTCGGRSCSWALYRLNFKPCMVMMPDGGHRKDATGWRRLIGYHKLRVFSRKRGINYRAHAKLVDNFSHKSDVTSPKTPF